MCVRACSRIYSRGSGSCPARQTRGDTHTRAAPPCGSCPAHQTRGDTHTSRPPLWFMSSSSDEGGHTHEPPPLVVHVLLIRQEGPIPMFVSVCTHVQLKKRGSAFDTSPWVRSFSYPPPPTILCACGACLVNFFLVSLSHSLARSLDLVEKVVQVGKEIMMVERVVQVADGRESGPGG